MNWTASAPILHAGESWGQKDVEFERFMTIPTRLPGVPFAVAVNQTVGASFPRARLEASGWTVLDPHRCVGDWRSYRAFIAGSRGEFSVAKETYVKGRTGWFSCRSACYLAAGRPVVTQDTRWSCHLPTGEGLFAFTDEDSAIAALESIESRPEFHGEAARALAEQYFASARVLTDLLSPTMVI
jgi:hypothetical protein